MGFRFCALIAMWDDIKTAEFVPINPQIISLTFQSPRLFFRKTPMPDPEEISPGKKSKREPSPVYLLASFFVTEILKREWTTTDQKGMHLKQAKQVYDDYGLDDVVGCLEAWRDNLLGGLDYWPPKTLVAIRYGEPPMIERWMAWKKTPPPIYQKEATGEWIKRSRYGSGDVSPVGEPSDDMLLRSPELRPAVPPPED